jgi:hypothetical protein
MFTSERRTPFRGKLQLPLRFHRQNALAEDENGATSSTSRRAACISFPVLRYRSGRRLKFDENA